MNFALLDLREICIFPLTIDAAVNLIVIFLFGSVPANFLLLGSNVFYVIFCETPMKRLVVKKSIEINAPASKVCGIIAAPNTWKQWILVVPEVENDEPLDLRRKVLWKNESGKAYLTGTITGF